MSWDDFLRKFRDWMTDDVAARNEMGGNRTIFGRPEWEVGRGGQRCCECGSMPTDLKRIVDHTGRVIGIYCTPCAYRSGHI